MRALWVLPLACAALLSGCMPSRSLHERPHLQDWEPAQAREVLRVSLQYAGMRDIQVGCHGFSFVEPLDGPFVDTCERIEVAFDDIERVEMTVTELDYRVVVHQCSKGGGASAELPFATRRTARHCADALATLSHH